MHVLPEEALDAVVRVLEALAIAAGVLPEAERVAYPTRSSAASTRPR